MSENKINLPKTYIREDELKEWIIKALIPKFEGWEVTMRISGLCDSAREMREFIEEIKRGC